MPCSPICLRLHEIWFPASLRLWPLLPPLSCSAVSSRRLLRPAASFSMRNCSAYKRLYHSALVNGHLLPPAAPKQELDAVIEKKNSPYQVSALFDPWRAIREKFKFEVQEPLYAHKIHITGPGAALPPLIFLLPVPLKDVHDCKLNIEVGKFCIARFEKLATRITLPLALGRKITRHLFNLVFSRRLCVFEERESELPYVLIPDLPVEKLESWFLESQKTHPLGDVVFNSNLAAQTYLALEKDRSIPYFYTPCFDQGESLKLGNGDAIQAVRLSPRMDFFAAPPLFAPPTPQTLSVSECSILGLSAGYGEAMTYIPTILHQAELALRAQAAADGPLKSVGFRKLGPVISALTTPEAGSRHHQRLEYLGDMVLKFYSAVHFFCNKPQMPESQLAITRERIINNPRLRRSAQKLDLETYITSSALSGQHWTAEKTLEVTNRKLSSKVIADTVEALLGAAYIDGEDFEDHSKLLAAFSLFLPEIEWRSPACDVATYKLSLTGSQSDLVDLTPVEKMIGFKFTNRNLLLEALTYSAAQVGRQTYERLEFLGDAIIDRIVKMELYQSRHNFSVQAIERRSSALLNEHIFSFFNFQTYHTLERYSMAMDTKTKTPKFQAETRKIYLNDYVRRTKTDIVVAQRETFLARYAEVQSNISEALAHSKSYPWSKLFYYDAPKAYSDVIESIVAAVYIDTNGSLGAARDVLAKLGLMKVVARFADETDLELTHPVGRLKIALPAAKVVARRYGTKRQGTFRWGGRVVLNDDKDEDTVVIGSFRSATCRAEAESRAAENALEILSKERKRKEEEEDVDEQPPRYENAG